MTPHSLTVVEACRRYGFGKTTLYELIAAKKIAAVKLGSRTLVLADSVERHLATLPAVGAEKLRHTTVGEAGASNNLEERAG